MLTRNHPTQLREVASEVIATPSVPQKLVSSAEPAHVTYRRSTFRNRTLVKTHIAAAVVGAVLWSQLMHGHPVDSKANAATPTSLASKQPAPTQGP